MPKASPNLHTLLSRVLAQPTAPFRESWAKAAFVQECMRQEAPCWSDSIGNLWLGASDLVSMRRAELVFVAHLDHPGFVVDGFFRKKGASFAKARWLGGGPPEMRGSNVCVFSDFHAGVRMRGTIRATTHGPRGVDRAVIELENSPLSHSIAATSKTSLLDLGPWGACLSYHECPTGVRFQKRHCVTKAADDLVGACALVFAFLKAKKKDKIAVCLTRAEESGFHGALEVLRRGWLHPSHTRMISVETSSWRAGAALGGGPVLRLGDRISLFDHFLVEWMESVASKLAKKPGDFSYQKKVMDGGSCEASAFKCFGFQVAGLSTPLENYHNVDPKTKKAAAEIVHVGDVEKLSRLLCALFEDYDDASLERWRRNPLSDFKKRLLKNHQKHLRYF